MAEYEKQILDTLSRGGALLTRDIAARVRPMFGSSNHMHSAAVRSWLLGLEHKGLVGRLDDQKPVVWKLTGKERT